MIVEITMKLHPGLPAPARARRRGGSKTHRRRAAPPPDVTRKAAEGRSRQKVRVRRLAYRILYYTIPIHTVYIYIYIYVFTYLGIVSRISLPIYIYIYTYSYMYSAYIVLYCALRSADDCWGVATHALSVVRPIFILSIST